MSYMIHMSRRVNLDPCKILTFTGGKTKIVSLYSHSTSMCLAIYQAHHLSTGCDQVMQLYFSVYCQVTEWLSADVNDSQFCFSQVLKDCLGDVKGSLFVANGDNRTTHCAIGFTIYTQIQIHNSYTPGNGVSLHPAASLQVMHIQQYYFVIYIASQPAGLLLIQQDGDDRRMGCCLCCLGCGDYDACGRWQCCEFKQ